MRMVPAFQQSKFWKAAIPEFQAIFQASGSPVKSTDERQMKNMMKNIIIFEKKLAKCLRLVYTKQVSRQDSKKPEVMVDWSSG